MKVLSILLAASLTTASLAATYPCPYPPNTEKFSAIVLGDMASAAHNIYSGVAVGGEYSNPVSSTQSVAVDGESYVGSIKSPITINWNEGVVEGADLKTDAGIDFSYFEYMAENVITGSSGGYKIVRKNTGGKFNTFDFRNGGQGEDNGKTIVFFNTTATVTLTKTSDGRQFGPTIIAPFSHVVVKGNAGFVDGLIVAKKLTTNGNNAGQLQLHGDYFTGPMNCKALPSSPSPSTSPSTSPTPPAPTPGSNGDPHFKTWKNEHYEYHGQCDMILVKDPNFANGVGIEVQIRTKLVRYWSYIKNVVIRIGNDILEVEGSADPSTDFRYWYNMEFRSPDLKEVGGFPVTIKHREYGHYKRGLEIDLSSIFPGEKIEVATWKEFIRVDFKNPSSASFGDSVGLLGNFHTGNTLGRDGITVLDDFWTFGNEWQVLANEDMLFHIFEKPQFPSMCLVPEDAQGQRRRLDESSVTQEQAEDACSSLNDELDRKDCVYDILATQDLDMVGAF